MWGYLVAILSFTFTAVHLLLHFRRTKLRSIVSKYKEVLLVFAHPDDETMFFLPLILTLQTVQVRVRLLCLSTGNYDGMGPVRVQELQAVGRALGALSCDIVDEPKLPDGPHAWLSEVVASTVRQYLVGHSKVSAIFTFDNYGVSGHPNHVSVERGMRELVRSKGCSTPVFSLKSVSIWRKYLPVVDGLVTLLWSSSDTLLAVNVWDPMKAVKLMRLYGSQNVWFRKLFSVFSKYSYTNEFEQLA